MYIGRVPARNNTTGESYFTHRLARTERVANMVRQITLLDLGRHFAVAQEDWPSLCPRIEEILCRIPSPCRPSSPTWPARALPRRPAPPHLPPPHSRSPPLAREPVAAQDGPGHRAIMALTLASSPVTRQSRVSGWGSAGRVTCRPRDSCGEGAEGAAFVRPMRGWLDDSDPLPRQWARSSGLDTAASHAAPALSVARGDQRIEITYNRGVNALYFRSRETIITTKQRGKGIAADYENVGSVCG